MEKVAIIVKENKIKQAKNNIKNLDRPLNQIKCASNSKILGHQMSTNPNTKIAINDRIKKARLAWAQLKYTFITKRF